MSQGQPIEERRSCPAVNCQKPEEAARSAVKQVFNILGVDVDDPKQVEDFREGLRFGEGLLEMSKRGKIAVMLSVIGLATVAVWYSLFGRPT